MAVNVLLDGSINAEKPMLTLTNVVSVDDPVTSLEIEALIASHPVAAIAHLIYHLEISTEISLEVYDITGEMVLTIEEGQKSRGDYYGRA